MIAAIYGLIFLLMMAVPRAAEAECAWVLWQHQGAPWIPPGPHARPDKDLGPYRFTWVVDGAYATEAACRAELKLWDAMPAKREGLYILMKDGTKIRPVCLPDTVDPRGVKGER